MKRASAGKVLVLGAVLSALSLAGFAALPCLRSRAGGRTVVLYSMADPPVMRSTPCEGPCEAIAIEYFACTPTRWLRPARTVIVTGHSLPPMYLGRSPARVASAVACFDPDLVVLDTCYGFSLPLLGALADDGVHAIVVGPAFRLPPEGLDYAAGFFSNAPAVSRAGAVATRSGMPLGRWSISTADLAASQRDVATWSVDKLEANLQVVLPGLVRIPLGTSAALAYVPADRFLRPE
jgi:hypothetical protein